MKIMQFRTLFWKLHGLSSQRLCAYISCSALREVDSSKLLSEIVHTPAKDAKEVEREIDFVYIKSTDRFCNASRKLIVPQDHSPKSTTTLYFEAFSNEKHVYAIANEPVDLFLLPGLAFDRSGRRLGHGGGCYDTFLKKYLELTKERNWRQPLLVALSYSLQILDEGTIPVTPNDIPVDALVSPSGVIPIIPAALDRMQL